MTRILPLICAVLLSANSLLAQADPGAPAQRGIQPNSVYSVSDLDSVDLRSGNLSLRIPLASLPPGPGGSSAHVGLIYNSQIYDQTGTGTDTNDTYVGFRPRGLANSTTGGGWKYSYQYSFFEEPRALNGTSADCGAPDHEHQYKHYMIFPDGSRHLLRMEVSTQMGSGLHPYASLDDYNLYNVDGLNVRCGYPAIDRPTLYTDDGTYVRVLTNSVFQWQGAVTVTAGAAAPATVVTLTANGVPNGWSVTFNPNQVSVAAGNSRWASITITPPSAAASGNYSIGIAGTSGGATSTTTLTVKIPDDGVTVVGAAGSIPPAGFGVGGTVVGLSNLAWTAYFPDGQTVAGVGAHTTAITDRNQNTINVQGYFDPTGAGDGAEVIISDQANRRVKVFHQLAVAPAVASDVVTRESCSSSTLCGPVDSNWQVNQTWQVDWKYYTGTARIYPCDVNFGATCRFTPSGTYVSQVTLPLAADTTARTYQFQYNTESSSDPADATNGWGELRTMTTPGGYRASYHYTFDASTSRGLDVPVVWNPMTSKVGTQTDGQGISRTETWTYTPCITLPCAGTVTAPDGGTTTTSYTSVDGLAWKIEQPNHDKITRLWWYNRAPNSIPPATRNEQVANPYVKAEWRTISASGGPKLASVKNYSYDKNNNLLNADEYDCLTNACGTFNADAIPAGPPSGLTATRHSELTYGTNTSTADAGTSDPPAAQADAYWRGATAPRLLGAKLTQKVTGTGDQRYSEFTYDQSRGTGNLLKQLDYDSSKLVAISYPLVKDWNAIQSFTGDYDLYGNLSHRYDAKGTQTYYEYGAGSCMNSYPTAVNVFYGTSEALRTTMTPDCPTGLLTSTADPNGMSTGYTYDILGRVLSVTEGAGANQRATTATYSDANRTATTVSPLDARTLTTTESYDARGRVVFTYAPNDNGGCTQRTVEHRYLTPTSSDTTGAYGYSYELVSNPYCTTADPATMGWTRTKRDPSGRVVEVAHYTGGTPPAPWTAGTGPAADSGSRTTFDGEKATVDVLYHNVTPQTARSRTTQVDGLGRMVAVKEDPNGSAYVTTYGYDVRDALTSVAQVRKATGMADVPQNRIFDYDSLGRLKSATNVESGKTQYTYDPNGNVATVKLASGTTRTLQYNTRNQILSKTYNLANTPTVTYCYDGKVPTGGTCGTPTTTIPYAAGRLTGVGTTVAATNYTGYDSLGRVLNSEQWVDGVRYPFAYQYLRGGELSYEQYPSGRQLSYEYNNAGQAKSLANGATVGNCANGCYAAGLAYAPHGGMQSGTLGPLTETYGYNGLLQVNGITAKHGSTTLWSLTNTYDTPLNDGNIVVQAVDARGAGGINVTATLGYDSLNRLASTQEGGSGTAAQGHEYDSVGNRWVTSGQTLSAWTPATANWYDGATNRITNAGVPNGTFQYDAGGDGNMTGMGGAGLTYDAEGRQVTATLNGTTQYWYDGDGRRVKKQVGTGTPTVYVYDAGGELAAEYGGTGAVSGTQYVVQDHLGSTRMVVDGAGNCQALHDYLPFGEEILQGVWGRTGTCVYGGADGATQKFTGKERDAELASSTMQGLDYFGARYYSGAQGRFTSPDWSATPQPIPYADLSNPQTLNLYSYVINNPLNRIDPLGHNWFNIDDKWEWHKGKSYTRTDSEGNQQTYKSKYTGLLVAQRTGTNAKGASTYNLTLYDQNKVVGTGTAFSGGQGHNPIKDGNYQILTEHDPTKPTAPSPGDPDNNPPVSYKTQQIDRALNGYAEAVFQAYGPIRARLNPLSGRDAGDYFHGQFNGYGWTHGCLCYGTDTRMIDYIWNKMPNTWVGVGVDVPVIKP